MNSFSGTLALSAASMIFILSCENGKYASLYTRSITGDMIKKVRNNAKPSSTWLGGEDCVPRANLSSDNTMIIRVKLDIINTTAGKNVSEVSRISVCRLSEYVALPSAFGELVNAGKPDFCAKAGTAIKPANNSMARNA